MDYVIPRWDAASVPVADSALGFPVRHIYCVGRNYAEHAKEMGGDAAKEPPFFFTKPADAVVPVLPPATGSVHFPLASKNYQHEIELVVAIGRRGVKPRPRRSARSIRSPRSVTRRRAASGSTSTAPRGRTATSPT